MLTLIFPMLQLQKTPENLVADPKGFCCRSVAKKSLVASRRIPGIPYPHASALQLVPVSWRIFFPFRFVPSENVPATDLYFRMSSVFFTKNWGDSWGNLLGFGWKLLLGLSFWQVELAGTLTLTAKAPEKWMVGRGSFRYGFWACFQRLC